MFQLQNVIAHIFLYGRYCIFLLSQGEYNAADGIQYASEEDKKREASPTAAHIHLANYFNVYTKYIKQLPTTWDPMKKGKI